MAYQIPCFLPDHIRGSPPTQIGRAGCSVCTEDSCATFIPQEDASCLCGHPWHAHVPEGPEELPPSLARFQAGPRTTNHCTQWYPGFIPATTRTPCVCGSLINAYARRQPLPGSLIPHAVLSVPAQPPSSNLTIPPLPRVPAPAQPLSAPNPATVPATPLPSTALQSTANLPSVDVLLQRPSTGQDASVRRIQEAATTFGVRIHANTRALAPGPLSTPVTGLGAAFAPAGARSAILPGYTTTPTAVPLPAGPAPSVLTPAPPYDVTFVMYPCTFRASNAQVEEWKAGSGRVEPLSIELETRHNNLIRHLYSLKLVYQFTCPDELRTATGKQFLEGLDQWLRRSLAAEGYFLEPRKASASGSAVSYATLAWRFVYYKMARTTVSLGRSHREKRRVLMSEPLDKFDELSLAAFDAMPFGSSEKRPKDPTTTMKKPVVYIMCREHDLMAREPIDPTLRRFGRWPTEPTPLVFPTTRYSFVHRCFSQRALQGWQSEEEDADEGPLECCTQCFVAIDPEILNPTLASMASPIGLGEVVQLDHQRGLSLQQIVDERQRNLAPVIEVAHTTTLTETPTAPAASIDVTPSVAPDAAPAAFVPPLVRVNAAPSLRVTIPPPAQQLDIMLTSAPATPNPPSSSTVPPPPNPFLLERVGARRQRSPSLEEVQSSSPNQRRRLEPMPLFPQLETPFTCTLESTRFVNRIRDTIKEAADLLSLPSARLWAPDIHQAAVAIYNAIVCIRFSQADGWEGWEEGLVEQDSSTFRWTPFRPQQLESLVSNFNFTIEIGPDGSGSSGSGTLRSVAPALVELSACRQITFRSHSGRYLSVQPRDGFMVSSQQQAKLDALGVATFLHIVWTGLGPEPISPFLIFHALESNPLELVVAGFIHHLDDDERIVALLDGVIKVESRRENGAHPVLKPVETELTNYCETQIADVELTRTYMDVPHLRNVLFSLISEVIGLKGAGKPTRPEVEQFCAAFRNCLPFLSDSIALPTGREARMFVASLYNRHPSGLVDLNLRSKTSGNLGLVNTEKRWMGELRRYLSGNGTPAFAGWAPKPSGIDLNTAGGRSCLIMKALTGSTMIPTENSWTLQVVFVDNTAPDAGGMIFNRRPTATRFITHVCFKSIEVSLEPVTDYILGCADVFDAVLHAGLVVAEGFSREILPTAQG